MACCQRPNSSGEYEYGCRSVSICAAANAAGDPTYGLNCWGAKDCPVGTVCCQNGGFGHSWNVCATSCAVNNQFCYPASPTAECLEPGNTCHQEPGTFYGRCY
jgi:hypothetical protein